VLDDCRAVPADAPHRDIFAQVAVPVHSEWQRAKRAEGLIVGDSEHMPGDDLPNLLSAVSIALTLVVIFFARRTVTEAKQATAEEKNTVRELTKLLTAVGELTASSERSVKAGEQTLEFAVKTWDTERRHSHASKLRHVLKIVDEIHGKGARTFEPADPGNSWRCDEQDYLEAELTRLDGTDLPRCRVLARSRGVDNVVIAASEAKVELERTLLALGFSPRATA
jgi:hypothetical protein